MDMVHHNLSHPSLATQSFCMVTPISARACFDAARAYLSLMSSYASAVIEAPGLCGDLRLLE
jgi:hypothetical protein